LYGVRYVFVIIFNMFLHIALYRMCTDDEVLEVATMSTNGCAKAADYSSPYRLVVLIKVLDCGLTD